MYLFYSTYVAADVYQQEIHSRCPQQIKQSTHLKKI